MSASKTVIQQMIAEELKKELWDRCLRVSGRKADLVQRLMENEVRRK